MADVKISDIAAPAGAIASTDLVEGEVSGTSAKLTLAEVFTAGKSAASESATGAIELATLAEVSTGTDTTRAVTPAGVKQETNLLIPKSIIDAETILYGTVDNTPAALPVAASRVVGRKASGSISDLTAAETRTILGTAPFVIGSDADGDTWYRASGALSRVAKGTALQYYRMNSGASAPEWVTAVPGEGHLVQTVGTSISSVITCTTVIPHDDTKPQITEGNEIIKQKITPQDALNILTIVVNVVPTYGISANIGCLALFLTGTSDALAAVLSWLYSPVTLVHKMVAGGTSEIEFAVRFGPKAAGETIYINSQYNSSTRVFGGVSATTITITESMP